MSVSAALISFARRHPALLLLWAAGIAAAAVLDWSGSGAFQPYFGDLDPVLATAAIAVVGLLCLAWLEHGEWFSVHIVTESPRGFSLSAKLATALAVPVIVVDLAGGFPESINAPMPGALLFYPAIALVAETIFHVAPLALLLLLARLLVPRMGREAVLLGCMLAAALPEPIFQVLAGSAESPGWANAYVGIHLTVFNVLAVYLFKRHGFFTVYVFRMFYYMIWHIVWGVVRLRLIF
jgi:hypothetical protein